MDFSAQNPATSNALNLAARTNDVENVARLLQTLNPNCVDNRGWTCLHEAAYHDSYESMMLILKSPEVRVLAESHEGHTALYLACKNNCSYRTIKALLDSAEDIANYGSTEGVTPLHIATSQGHIQLMEILLQYGAMINVQDFDGDTPLHEAAMQDEHEALLTLLYAGADPEIQNIPEGFTPFHLACSQGYTPNIKSLFPFVYDINQPTTSGDTALHYAIRGFASTDVINFLLANGADPNLQNEDGEVPIDLLCSNVEVLIKLLSVTHKEKINRSIVLDACMAHTFELDILETLLYSDLGSDFFNHCTAFNTEIHKGHINKNVYHANAPLNRYLSICLYIHEISPEKFREFFYLFLMQGANVNPLHVSECPPLVYVQFIFRAAQDTSPLYEVLQLLIEQGCNVDYCSSDKNAEIGISNSSNNVIFSDAFRTSLDVFHLSLPAMMPYSLYSEPEDLLKLAIKYNVIMAMPTEVRQQLMAMIDKTFINFWPHLLDSHVPCLKHLCRYSIRSQFRKSPTKYTTTTFLAAINTLPIPAVLKSYLRFIDF